jgi:endonuclease/exonuclease/phosphatase (EEP) superfamily protein YafD
VSTPQSSNVARRSEGRLRHYLERLLVVSAWAYPAGLLTAWLALALLGEGWWVTAALLYVPRILFAAPLVLLVPGLLLLRRRELLWTQALSALITVFPLMGFTLPWLPPGDAAAKGLKLMSLNVASEWMGEDAVLREVDANSPEIVLLQETTWGSPLLEGLKKRYPHAEASTQFVIASRYPILERTDPPKIPHYGRQRSPRFMRYLVQSPLGKLAVYNLHPISPRGTLGIHGFRGTFHNLRTGQLSLADPEADIGANAALRSAQVTAAANMARAEKVPVLLAGDTNLPGSSVTLRRQLGDYADAFRDASWGFGYTYPQKYPFLRLDRIMASPELAFREFERGCAGVSDHFCVMARVVKR